MTGARALLFAFFGDIAWFLETTTHQSTGACSRFSHYTPSAALALIVITGLSAITEVLVMSPADRRRLPQSLTRNATAAACLSAIGLAVAVFFSAVISCSGG